MDEDAERTLPCAPLTCPICFSRLRDMPRPEAPAGVQLWRTRCRRCGKRLTLKLEDAPDGELECRHSLAGGQLCRDVIRCNQEWPLELP